MEFYPHPCDLRAITDEAIEECDGIDGIVDGLISNDVACKLDPLSVVGKTFNSSDTGKNMKISKEAAMLARASWSGPETEEGKFMWYGPNIGSQLTGSTAALTNDIGLAMTSCSSNGTCVGVPVGLGEVWIKYFMEANPKWSYKSMTRSEFETYTRVAKQSYESLIGTSDPDLTAFHKTGGKILGYHGMVGNLTPHIWAVC